MRQRREPRATRRVPGGFASRERTREKRLKNCGIERGQSEFEVQTELYAGLKAALPGFIVRGEFPYWHVGEAGKLKKVIFDVAVFDRTGKLLICVEVKRLARSRAKRQGVLYPKVSGKRCIYARGMASIPEVIREVVSFVSAG